jgi:3-hydroxybutyryl-CoA dehydrogenase
MRLDGSTIVGVVGAGAMGAGIAQVAAVRGHRVVIADASSDAIERARQGHARAMVREVEKGRLSREDADAVLARISYVPEMTESSLQAFADCGLVIEAIIESLPAKRELFRVLEVVIDPSSVLATNTSSLSVAALAGGSLHPSRIVGIHFFNPAPVMPLVEIIPSIVTDAAITASVRALVDGWKKTTVLAADTPGFIVNRVARPFYGEALRILEEGIADAATIDWAMKTLGGFKMGPFELMDFIGNDVNFAVTSSVFEAMFFDPRYKPALTQRRLVEAGWLGRKSGRGYYEYREGVAMPEPLVDATLGQQIVDRIVAMLVNEAAEAVHLRIASPADLERAMTTGVNYPKGLLAWGDDIGATTILARLEALQAEHGEDRYRPSPYLRRVVRNGGTLLGGVV